MIANQGHLEGADFDLLDTVCRVRREGEVPALESIEFIRDGVPHLLAQFLVKNRAPE